MEPLVAGIEWSARRGFRTLPGLQRAESSAERVGRRQFIGRDSDSVGRLTERRDAPTRILSIASSDRLQHSGFRLLSVLKRPPSGALLRRCRYPELNCRVRKHDGANIPADHHDASPRGERSLTFHERFSHARMRGHLRHRRIDYRGSYLGPGTHAVNEEAFSGVVE